MPMRRRGARKLENYGYLFPKLEKWVILIMTRKLAVRSRAQKEGCHGHQENKVQKAGA
jgi:hypothetical protein